MTSEYVVAYDAPWWLAIRDNQVQAKFLNEEHAKAFVDPENFKQALRIHEATAAVDELLANTVHKSRQLVLHLHSDASWKFWSRSPIDVPDELRRLLDNTQHELLSILYHGVLPDGSDPVNWGYIKEDEP